MRFNISQLRSQLEYAEKEKRSERLERSALFRCKELGFIRQGRVDLSLKCAFNKEYGIWVYGSTWMDVYIAALHQLIMLPYWEVKK